MGPTVGLIAFHGGDEVPPVAMLSGLQFLVVGNLSHDLLVCEGREVATLGGPPAYGARFFDAVGAHYKVVTKIGGDFLYADEFPGETLLGRKPAASLVHWPHGAARKSMLLSAGDCINPGELRDRANVGIAAGHVSEVPVPTVRRLRDLQKSAWLAHTSRRATARSYDPGTNPCQALGSNQEGPPRRPRWIVAAD